MVLHDAGHLDFEEPYTRFRAHGMIIREGAKMSKSRGNVVNPDEYVERWGADTFRTYLMFLGPYEEGGDFRDQSIAGVRRFLDRLWSSSSTRRARRRRLSAADPAVMRKLHQTIKKVSRRSARAELQHRGRRDDGVHERRSARGERVGAPGEVEPLVQLVAPFAPHVAEELWERLGHDRSVFDSGWPAFDASLAAEELITIAVQVGGKTRGTVQLPPGAGQDAAMEAALADPNISKFVAGPPKKVIFVPGRLLSIVV